MSLLWETVYKVLLKLTYIICTALVHIACWKANQFGQGLFALRKLMLIAPDCLPVTHVFGNGFKSVLHDLSLDWGELTSLESIASLPLLKVTEVFLQPSGTPHSCHDFSQMFVSPVVTLVISFSLLEQTYSASPFGIDSDSLNSS